MKNTRSVPLPKYGELYLRMAQGAFPPQKWGAKITKSSSSVLQPHLRNLKNYYDFLLLSSFLFGLKHTSSTINRQVSVRTHHQAYKQYLSNTSLRVIKAQYCVRARMVLPKGVTDKSNNGRVVASNASIVPFPPFSSDPTCTICDRPKWILLRYSTQIIVVFIQKGVEILILTYHGQCEGQVLST